MKLFRRTRDDGGEIPGRMSRSKTVGIGLAALGIALIALFVLSSLSRTSKASPRRNGLTTLFNPKLQAGVGTEVSLPAGNASTDQVQTSVESIAGFISSRSGLSIDRGTKARLVKLEARSLNGESARISADAYVNAISESVIERAATLTDQEIDRAAGVLESNGAIKLRASGQLTMSRQEFVDQARSFRQKSRDRDSATMAQVRSVLSDEVTTRVSQLTEGLPGQFGVLDSRGFTPAVAVLITYSVLTDDNLAHPSRTLAQFAAQHSLSRRLAQAKTLEQKRALAPESASVVKSYGPSGRLFATPADLLFDAATLNRFLNRLAEGGN